MNNYFIVLNYFDEDRIINLVTKVHKAYPEFNYIVVDNSCNENSFNKLSILSFANLIKSTENLGYTRGHNLAFDVILSNSTPDNVFVVNSDVDFNMDLIRKSIEIMLKYEDIGILTARMNEYGKEISSCWHLPNYKQYVNLNFWYLRNIQKPNIPYSLNENEEINYVDVVRGSFQCIRGSALKYVKKYDVNCFMYNFENIFSLNLLEYGFKTAIMTKEFYYHNHIYKKNSKDYKRKKIMFYDSCYYLKEYLKISKIQMFLYKLTFYSNYFLLVVYKKLFRK